MSAETLTPPVPVLDGPHQPGVTDPIWPLEPPPGLDAKKYAGAYAGRLERQRHLHLVMADVVGTSRAGLHETLLDLTELARIEMRKPPPKPERPYDPVLANRHVTVTIGFGATLFTTVEGDDRFGLAALRPAGLKIIPQVAGDDGFRPPAVATDLAILIASDDVYVNEYILGLLYYREQKRGIHVRTVERGYARPDSREPSGFEDGITNPPGVGAGSLMDELVYVQAHDPEPAWCVGGTYLAYRKVRRRLAPFFALEKPDRERVFGVHPHDGQRIRGAPSQAHSQKMNPRREGHRDLFDILDDERKMLRRPYFFDDGFDADGNENRGVHHLSFARNLLRQYEWPVLMWQTNPDFPNPGTGIDELYEVGGAANVAAGYYFIPAAPKPGACLGAAMVE